jgi:LPXTG-motif cell wall-anchored protein
MVYIVGRLSTYGEFDVKTTMDNRSRGRHSIVAAMLAAAAASAAALPGAASAAPPATDPAALIAVAEWDAATGRNKVYPVKQGETVPALLGVANAGAAPVKGAFLHVRVLDDLDITRKFDNCRYYVDSNLDGAWCKFDEELAVAGTYALSDDFVSATPDAKADKISAIVFRWLSGEYGTALGGLDGLVEKQVPGGGTGTAGTEGTLRLVAKPLVLDPDPAERRSINFAYPKLVVSATTAATTAPVGASPSLSVTPTVAAPATDPAEPGGEGGGLPATGTQTAAMAGVGGAVLLLGAAGYLIARRRRTRFVA